MCLLETIFVVVVFFSLGSCYVTIYMSYFVSFKKDNVYLLIIQFDNFTKKFFRCHFRRLYPLITKRNDVTENGDGN